MSLAVSTRCTACVTLPCQSCAPPADWTTRLKISIQNVRQELVSSFVNTTPALCLKKYAKPFTFMASQTSGRRYNLTAWRWTTPGMLPPRNTFSFTRKSLSYHKTQYYTQSECRLSLG